MIAESNALTLLVLQTGLYPIDNTLEIITDIFSTDPKIKLQRVDAENMNDSDWDELLCLILSVPKVITL